MGNQNLQLRIDPRVREEASTVLDAIGLSISDAVRVFLTKIAHEKRLPFDLTPNAETIEAMREARAGRTKKAGAVGDLLADLDASDD